MTQSNYTAPTLFEISGYWIDSPDETFSGFLVYAFDEQPDFLDDDAIFFYGLGESDIQSAISTGSAVNMEFVITSYTPCPSPVPLAA